MPSRVYEALATRWDAKSALAAAFPGGIWKDRAPPKTTYPYVVVTGAGFGSRGFTSGNEDGGAHYWDQRVQMLIFWKEDESSDPVSAVGTLMRTMDANIQEAPLSIPASEGHILRLQKVGWHEPTMEEEEDRIWTGGYDYEAQRREIVDLDPS